MWILCKWLGFCVLYCIEYISVVFLFQASNVREQVKKQADAAGTTVLYKVLSCTIGNVSLFFCIFLIYYLCKKDYKTITE